MIAEGDTQWMTAGWGILHDELPTERMYRAGGPMHGVQRGSTSRPRPADQLAPRNFARASPGAGPQGWRPVKAMSLVCSSASAATSTLGP